MADQGPTVRTAIVLQGGGALGAYEYGVLKALYERRPGFKPAVVAGTSIGAITAAVVGGARDDPISALDRLWRERLPVPSSALGPFDPTFWWPPQVRRALSVFGNPGMYRVRAEYLFAPWLSTSVYDTAPLRATLADLVDLDKLNNGGIRVSVGAIDLGTAEARFFDNSNGDLTFDHVVASGSLPPGFPMTEVDGETYWDGGLFTNTPLSPAINFLEQCDDGDPSVVRELIVVELFPMRAAIPDTMQEVLDRMTQLRYTSRLTLDQKLFKKMGGMIELMQRIDDELPPGSAVREDPAYVELRKHRKVDRFQVVTADFPDELSKASDFSPSSIDARIRIGYQNAIDQGICELPTAPARGRRPVPARA